MTQQMHWSRRRFLGTTASAAAGSLLAGSAIAPALLGSTSAQAKTDVTVGLIYVGPCNDFGWTRHMPSLPRPFAGARREATSGSNCIKDATDPSTATYVMQPT